jgi:hypothetical protein
MRPGRVHARADAARVGDGELLLCCIRRDGCWEDACTNDEASCVQGAGWRGHAGSLEVEGRLEGQVSSEVIKTQILMAWIFFSRAVDARPLRRTNECGPKMID